MIYGLSHSLSSAYPLIRAKNPIMGLAVNIRKLSIFIAGSLLVLSSSHGEESTGDFFTYSSFAVSPTRLRHYDWTYIRIDLPSFFSSLSIALESDVNFDQGTDKFPRSMLPIICFRDGGPPLPDVSDAALKGLVLSQFFHGSSEGIQYHRSVEQCYPLKKNNTLNLNYGQIKPGVLYVGLFNGIGPIRTQSKMVNHLAFFTWPWTGWMGAIHLGCNCFTAGCSMRRGTAGSNQQLGFSFHINRGQEHTFTANVTVEACTDLTAWGQYCNVTVDSLSCGQSDLEKLQQNDGYGMVDTHMDGNTVICKNSFRESCHGETDMKFYSLEITQDVNQMMITAADVRYSEVILMCHVRYGALPTETVHDYSVDMSKAPMVIHLPKIGTWYFSIQIKGAQEKPRNVCYSMKWKLLGCPQGKTGPNCSWERYKLQGFNRKNPTAPVVYLPGHEDLHLDLPNFPLEPLLSKSSCGNCTDSSWTYFLLDVPYGAAGKNIHIQLIPEKTLNYEVYALFGGLPTRDMWDYSYSNGSGNSNTDSMFKLYGSREGRIDFYILYASEGPWGIGLRHPSYKDQPSGQQTAMSVSIRGCPNQCCKHGTCLYRNDASGSSDYSYCSCGRTHGGFDCSTRTVSREEQRWQSISLIASNAAAILPAFLALRKKAFADSVTFICSGISSGLYHACDVGRGCVLPYHTLQFMDFWLSFMAVVCTFVFLTTVSEAAKRTIHTIASILTALMAITSTTRSKNIGLVMGIGATGLLFGWLMEIWTTHKPYSFSSACCFNIFLKWRNLDVWLPKVMKTFLRRFRWRFMLLGFIGLSMAAISWKLETTQSYWIWHSMWHLSIYASSFFFLFSKPATLTGGSQVDSHTTSQLALEDSMA